MRTSSHVRWALVGLLCLLPAFARSQEDGNFKVQDEEAKTPQRKSPGIFHRPGKASPAEQLTYADALRRDGKLSRAIKEYDNLVHAWHDTPEAVLAQRAQSDLLFERGKFKPAFEAYQYLVDFYAGQFPFEPVIQRQFEIANVVKNQRYARLWILPGVLDPQQALPLFEAIVRNAPNGDLAQESLFNMALIQEDDKEFDKAVELYERIQLRYPDGRYTASATFARARCLYQAARSRGRDEGQIRNAVSAFSTYLRDYPSDPNAASARKYLDELRSILSDMYFSRATYYDNVEKNAKAAVVAYRDFVRTFPMSNLRERAEARIAQLSATTEEKK